ncbi:MAG: acetyltransferase [halophilic archaeon J07HB67]|jgi:Acetyltransferases, including N-acetylases of ribosomal proteins|nr:MAG: acetyltransferase [halophilic archaeon J07HB67]
MSRSYPDTAAGPYEPPPRRVTDREGREIELRVFAADDTEFEAAVAMYEGFDAADRAQGIPPSDEHRIREWLDTITGDDCHNVFAWDGGTVAGHATLVPDDDAHELAIFVDQAYQGAGVGTVLIRALLGHGARVGIERVWLTVERWNRAAVALYEKVGFETASAESFELEMAARLVDSDADNTRDDEGAGGNESADTHGGASSGPDDTTEDDGDDGVDTGDDFVTTTRGESDTNTE